MHLFRNRVLNRREHSKIHLAKTLFSLAFSIYGWGGEEISLVKLLHKTLLIGHILWISDIFIISLFKGSFCTSTRCCYWLYFWISLSYIFFLVMGINRIISSSLYLKWLVIFDSQFCSSYSCNCIIINRENCCCLSLFLSSIIIAAAVKNASSILV